MNHLARRTTSWLYSIASISSILLVGLAGCGGGGGSGQPESVSRPPTEIDTSYGSQGQITFSFGVKNGRVGPAVLQPDGKLLVAGWRNTGLIPSGPGSNKEPKQIYVLRFNGDGSPDTTFGTGGEARFNVNGSDPLTKIKLQSDGKILLQSDSIEPCVNTTECLTLPPRLLPDGREVYGGSALIRMTPQGTSDTTFGGTGVIPTETATRGSALAVQPDGKILFLRATGVPRVNILGWTLVRYNRDGTLDATFSQGNLTSSLCMANGEALVVQADGKIVVGGPPNPASEFCLQRLNPDLSHDASFSSMRTGGFNYLRSLATQPNGGLLTVMSDCDATGCEVAAFRNMPDGVIDTSFGAGGKASARVDASFVFIKHELTPSGGSIIFGYTRPTGVAGQPQQYQPVWIRFDANGQPVKGFGVDGILFGASDTKQPRDFIRDSEGRWLVIYVSTLSDGNLGLTVTRFFGERL